MKYVLCNHVLIFAGSIGVAWAIVWFLVVKNSPSEDPNISEEERLYIETSLANDVQKKVCNYLSNLSYFDLYNYIFMYMLQVRLNLQVNSFPNQINSFQPMSICFNPGQFVSTWVSLFQPRSVWGRYKTQVTGHCFNNTESILNIR